MPSFRNVCKQKKRSCCRGRALWSRSLVFAHLNQQKKADNCPCNCLDTYTHTLVESSTYLIQINVRNLVRIWIELYKGKLLSRNSVQHMFKSFNSVWITNCNESVIFLKKNVSLNFPPKFKNMSLVTTKITSYFQSL